MLVVIILVMSAPYSKIYADHINKTLYTVTFVSIRLIEIQKAFMFVINSKENILVSSNGIFHRNTAQEQYKLEREMGEGRT